MPGLTNGRFGGLVWHYVLRRLYQMVPVVFLVSVIVFLLIHITPGDPATALAGEEATPEEIAAVRERLGLDDPLPVQYFRWASLAVRGDLGRSIMSHQPVSEVIRERLPVTVQLALFSVALSIAIGIPVGVIAAVRRNSPIDTLSTVVAMCGVALPNFFLAIMLILFFAVFLRWLPPIGYTPLFDDPVDNLKRMIMPTIALGTGLAAVILRMTRSSLLEVLDEDYVRTARAKGLSVRHTVRVHALKNALIPVITVVGLQIGSLLGGAVITETIFAVPGVGRLLVSSIYMRDYPVVQGVVLFAAIAFMFVNLVVDILYAFIDPRIRYT